MPDRRCVPGIGETVYARGLTSSAFELQVEASLEVVADAGLKPSKIEGVLPIGVVSPSFSICH